MESSLTGDTNSIDSPMGFVESSGAEQELTFITIIIFKGHTDIIRILRRIIMPSSLTAKLSQLKFPPVCVVCMSSAVREYELEKIFTYGRRSHTVRMKVPMCDTHAEAASFKGPAEKFMGNFAIIGGILCGFFAATLLIMRWVGQVGFVAKIFGGALFGVGTFIIIWWVVTASIAPLFATPQSKEARSAVQIAMYWPKDEIVRLNIKNDRLAELIQKAN